MNLPRIFCAAFSNISYRGYFRKFFIICIARAPHSFRWAVEPLRHVIECMFCGAATFQRKKMFSHKPCSLTPSRTQSGRGRLFNCKVFSDLHWRRTCYRAKSIAIDWRWPIRALLFVYVEKKNNNTNIMYLQSPLANGYRWLDGIHTFCAFWLRKSYFDYTNTHSGNTCAWQANTKLKHRESQTTIFIMRMNLFCIFFQFNGGSSRKLYSPFFSSISLSFFV